MSTLVKRTISEKQGVVMDFLGKNPGSTVEIISTKTGMSKTVVRDTLKTLGNKVGKAPGTFAYSAIEIQKGTKAKGKRNFGRNFKPFHFNGKDLHKGKLVHAIVNEFVSTHQDADLTELKKVFSDELLPVYGIIAPQKVAAKKAKRYFMKKDQLISLKDGTKVAVCSQFSTSNIQPFLKIARNLGFKFRAAH